MWWLGLGLLALLAMPFDRSLFALIGRIPLGGDIRRELMMLQQYGQGSLSVIAVIVILRLDRQCVPQLLDWAAAAVLVWVVGLGLKMLFGRPRPVLNDPFGFLGVGGTHDFGDPVGVVHAWAFWEQAASELWSMPSSHTAFAAVMSVVLASMYPRLSKLCLFMVCVVGFTRVWTGAHYPSDVLMGAALGGGLTALALRRRWGQRAVERAKGGRLASHAEEGR